MATDIQTTTPEAIFRDKAAAGFHAAADMTLHQLVDEYLRLTVLVETHTTVTTEGYDQARSIDDEGKVALRDRMVINSAVKARFGICFAEYDRRSYSDSDF